MLSIVDENLATSNGEENIYKERYYKHYLISNGSKKIQIRIFLDEKILSLDGKDISKRGGETLKLLI